MTGRWFLIPILVGLCYFLTGRVGLLLAIPPGYATAIWPASGIALFALLKYGWLGGVGVFLGHFLVNLSSGGEAAFSDPEAHLRSFGIALGGLSQALLGRYLIAKSVGLGDPLIKERRIYRFMFLGGPFACLLSPTLGVLTLYLTGAIPLNNISFSWVTWWVGDSMGVMIFTPILLILSQFKQSVWRSRVWSVVLPMMVVFSLSCALFFFIRGSMERDHANYFHQRINSFSNLVEDEVHHFEEVLFSLVQLHKAVRQIDKDTFQRYTESFLGQHKNLLAISWNPLIKGDELREQESVISSDLKNFFVKEKDSGGKFVPVRNREWHVPVTFIEPWSKNQGACGFDIASNPVRKKAILSAMESREAGATETIDLVQSSSSEKGLLMLYPVFENEEELPSGFYVCVFKVERLLSSLLPTEFDVRTRYSLRENIDGVERTVLSNSDGEELQPTVIKRLLIGDRVWVLRAAPTLEDMASMRGWRSWLFMVIGMLFTSLFCVYLFVGSGRRQAVKLEVDQRTSEMNLEIVKRRETESKLMVEKSNAEKATRAKSVFLANMSHEIRTPMNGILGSSMLLLDSKLNEDQRENVDLIHKSTSSLLNVLNDILDFSKLEESKVVLSPHAMDTKEFFKNLEQLFSNQAEEKGLTLVLEYESSKLAPYIKADETRLRQILVNLISNGIKFTESGGHVALRPYTQMREEQLIFGVMIEDTGIGMNEEQARRVFERFEQAEGDTSRRYGGTGLGMTICKSLSDLMGGSLRVESATGVGSVFYFEVPVEPCDGAEPVQETDLSRNYEKTIILAEDSSTNRLIAGKLLKKMGLTVLEAKNGLEVLELVEKDHALILMDIQMPDMDGLEATRRLMESGYDKPILALTANVSVEENERYRELGMKDVLAKPLEIKHLLDSLDHWLG